MTDQSTVAREIAKEWVTDPPDRALLAEQIEAALTRARQEGAEEMRERTAGLVEELLATTRSRNVLYPTGASKDREVAFVDAVALLRALTTSP